MLLGDGRTTRRTSRVLPDPPIRMTTNRRRTDNTQPDDPEVITTARPPQLSANQTLRSTFNTRPSNTTGNAPDDNSLDEEPTSGGVVRQWVSELTGGTRPSAGGVGTVRAPSQSEVQLLTAMFPDIGRDVILGVLQRRCVIYDYCCINISIRFAYATV